MSDACFLLNVTALKGQIPPHFMLRIAISPCKPSADGYGAIWTVGCRRCHMGFQTYDLVKKARLATCGDVRQIQPLSGDVSLSHFELGGAVLETSGLHHHPILPRSMMLEIPFDDDADQFDVGADTSNYDKIRQR